MQKRFAERLRKLRTEFEYSQAKLAAILKTNQQNIDRWERGINEPNYDTLISLATLFGITIGYLMGVE